MKEHSQAAADNRAKDVLPLGADIPHAGAKIQMTRPVAINTSGPALTATSDSPDAENQGLEKINIKSGRGVFAHGDEDHRPGNDRHHEGH